MTDHLKKLIARWACPLILSVVAGPAWADLATSIRNMTMDQLDIELRVVDEQGQPVGGSVIWSNVHLDGLGAGVQLDAATMERMAKRYASQSDFLDVNDLPGIVVERTDLQGVLHTGRQIGHARREFHYTFAAIRHGYLPQVVEGTGSLNQHEVVNVRLRRDPEARPEPGMEEFTRLMALAHAPVAGENLVGEARMKKLDALNQQMRELAVSLEKDGLHNAASAAYWALAAFPSVIRITSPNSDVRAVGYSNGGEGPQAEADRHHATMLNDRVPKLLINKSLLQQGFPDRGIKDATMGNAYLRAFYTTVSGPSAEQVLPSVYRIAIHQELRWGTPDKACALLQRAYRFEPATMPAADWQKFLGDVEKQRAKAGLPAAECHIEGLPGAAPHAG